MPHEVVTVANARGPQAVDFPDPYILRDKDGYLAFATGAGSYHLQVASSKDLSTWSMLPDPLPRLPSWASAFRGYTWAPSVLPRSGRFVLYYTTRVAASGLQCISRGISAVASGPYVDDSTRPLICQDGASSLCGSIDPSPFVDADGRAYLLWKSDENNDSCRTAPRIWAQALAGDGLSLLGGVVPLLTEDRRWEGTVIEGPSMLRRPEGYYLFYSANGWETRDYAVGYAQCSGPLGPCVKKTTDVPWLASSGTRLGPGGQEFFTTRSGETWMAYHAWTAPQTTYEAGGYRSLRLAPVTFDGAPRVDDSKGLGPDVRLAAH